MKGSYERRADGAASYGSTHRTSAAALIDAPRTAATDHELFLAMQNTDPAERSRIQQELTHRYTGLVRWLASRYANATVDMDGLVA